MVQICGATKVALVFGASGRVQAKAWRRRRVACRARHWSRDLGRRRRLRPRRRGRRHIGAVAVGAVAAVLTLEQRTRIPLAAFDPVVTRKAVPLHVAGHPNIVHNFRDAPPHYGISPPLVLAWRVVGKSADIVVGSVGDVSLVRASSREDHRGRRLRRGDGGQGRNKMTFKGDHQQATSKAEMMSLQPASLHCKDHFVPARSNACV